MLCMLSHNACGRSSCTTVSGLLAVRGKLARTVSTVAYGPCFRRTATFADSRLRTGAKDMAGRAGSHLVCPVTSPHASEHGRSLGRRRRGGRARPAGGWPRRRRRARAERAEQEGHQEVRVAEGDPGRSDTVKDHQVACVRTVRTVASVRTVCACACACKHLHVDSARGNA